MLVHGAFSDRHTNWEFVKPAFRKEFTVYAVARRGRGETDATEDHTLEDEVGDVVAVIEAVGEPVSWRGIPTARMRARRRGPAAGSSPKAGVVQPPRPDLFRGDVLARLEALADAGAAGTVRVEFFATRSWSPFASSKRCVPRMWPPTVADAAASMRDIRAFAKYEFEAGRYRAIDIPVHLQIGWESPRDLFVTDALAAVLPNALIGALPGQAHEGMTTARICTGRRSGAFLLGSAEIPAA